MVTLIISDETLQEAFQNHLNKLLEAGNYENPVKKALDTLLGYSGSMRGEMADQITNFMHTAMKTPEFQATLGAAIAAEMAKRAVDALEKKK